MLQLRLSGVLALCDFARERIGLATSYFIPQNTPKSRGFLGVKVSVQSVTMVDWFKNV